MGVVDIVRDQAQHHEDYVRRVWEALVKVWAPAPGGLDGLTEVEAISRLVCPAEVVRLREALAQAEAERDAMRRRAEEATVEARDIGWERDEARAALREWAEADAAVIAAGLDARAPDAAGGAYDAWGKASVRYAAAEAALRAIADKVSRRPEGGAL